MSYIDSSIIDYGLNVLVVESTRLLLHEVEPIDYATATSNFLAEKQNIVVTGPANASPKGRCVIVQTITDGVVLFGGTVNCWSIVDDKKTRLLASEQVTNPLAVLADNAFTMEAFPITMPGV